MILNILCLNPPGLTCFEYLMIFVTVFVCELISSDRLLENFIPCEKIVFFFAIVYLVYIARILNNN